MEEDYNSIIVPIYGYFKHGDVKWHIIEIDGNMLKGIDITPKGYIHTLHINKKEVYELTLLERNNLQ